MTQAWEEETAGFAGGYCPFPQVHPVQVCSASLQGDERAGGSLGSEDQTGVHMTTLLQPLWGFKAGGTRASLGWTNWLVPGRTGSLLWEECSRGPGLSWGSDA